MGVAHNLEGRGIIACERGELSEAANFLTQAIQAFASYGNIGCAAHALEAAAVVIATASRDRDRLAAELLTAAEQFRHQSGQQHRPWEKRAQLGPLKDRIVAAGATPGSATPGSATPGSATPGSATPDTAAPVPGRRYTLSVASMLAAEALQSLEAPYAS